MYPNLPNKFIRVDDVAEINAQSLVLIIQAVVTVIKYLRVLSGAKTMPGDEVRLVDFENFAEYLEE